MKKTTVERLYTAKVAELLNQSWYIHTSTMPGSQGEVAHIDLTDGSEIHRVVMYRGKDRRHRIYDAHIIRIVVGRNAQPVSPDWRCTIWNSELEILSQFEVAEIQQPDCRHPEGWYTDLKTARDIQAIRDQRWEDRHITMQRELGVAYKSIALRWIQQQHRMKTTKLEDITKMTRYTTHDGHVGFVIEARDKRFYLHA